MNPLLTFTDNKLNCKLRKTRKETFLTRMDSLLPWAKMLGVIEPVCPKVDTGRHFPNPLGTMLCIHYIQPWYNLYGGAMEDPLYEIATMCGRRVYK